MNLSAKVTAAGLTLLLSLCVMPKEPAHSHPDVSAEIGCVSTNGGESCDLMLEDTTDPVVADETKDPVVSYPSCADAQWVGPCIAPAKDDIPPYLLEEDGSVSLLSNA